jgi:N-acetylglucosaminyldiphosphoundecaprenol N-acetyl-beta-D-mannosaminyltransferase
MTTQHHPIATDFSNVTIPRQPVLPNEPNVSQAPDVCPKQKLEALRRLSEVIAADSGKPTLTNPCDVSETVKSSHVWGIDFHQVTMAETLQMIDKIIAKRQPTYAITANLNYAMLCSKHARLNEFTKRAGLVLCDGMPILWRSRLNSIKLPERVTGSDLIYRLAERSHQKGHRIFLYGAAEGVAEKAAAELKGQYPRCVIAGVLCPPFHATSEGEIAGQIDRIKRAQPDILLIALGQPKGEYWIEDHLAQLDVPLCIQVGASFDFVAGQAKRAPRVWQVIGLEWLYRACHDPKRLIPRYLQNGLFLLKTLRQECIQWLDSTPKSEKK